MSPEAQEAAVLENVVCQLEAEGFEVVVRPTGLRLPPFMQSHPPDAIAFGQGRNLAIEIVRRGSAAQKRLDKLRELLAGHSDWELRVYWVSPSNAPEPIEAASGKDIEQSIKAIERLANDGLHGAALLMAWAALEGLGRALLPEKLARPQTPGRLVEVLAGDGYVTPSEADRLRQLAKVRNQLIHGGLRAKATSRDIKSFAAMLKTLLRLLEEA